MWSPMKTEVVDRPDRERYEIKADGELAGFVDHTLAPGTITFTPQRSTGPSRARGWAVPWSVRHWTMYVNVSSPCPRCVPSSKNGSNVTRTTWTWSTDPPVGSRLFQEADRRSTHIFRKDGHGHRLRT